MKLYDKSPTLVNFGDGKIFPPYGLFGGKTGSCNYALINEGKENQRELKAKESVKLKQYDTFTSYPSGGGGWGNPMDRDPELVRNDARDELISLSSAREEYGVVIDGDDYEINWSETNKLRNKY